MTQATLHLVTLPGPNGQTTTAYFRSDRVDLDASITRAVGQYLRTELQYSPTVASQVQWHEINLAAVPSLYWQSQGLQFCGAFVVSALHDLANSHPYPKTYRPVSDSVQHPA